MRNRGPHFHTVMAALPLPGLACYDSDGEGKADQSEEENDEQTEQFQSSISKVITKPLNAAPEVITKV